MSVSLFTKSLRATAIAAGVAIAALPGAASAGALLQYGPTYLGVNDQGHLNFQALSGPAVGIPPGTPRSSQPFNFTTGAGPYGLFRAGVGDSTSPGCLCEGWGIAVTNDGDRVGAGADEAAGIFGFTDTGVFGSTSFSASSMVTMADAPIEIVHNFGPSIAPETFQGQVTITNTGTTTIEDVVYRRQMDWDIPPNEFSELVTHQGVEANLEFRGGNVRAAVDNGFVGGNVAGNPLSISDEIEDNTFNMDFIDSGAADHGSAFDFAFGNLAPGESRTFNIFYGSASNEAQAISRLDDILNVDVYSLGQNNTPTSAEDATFMFGFGGVGGVAVGSSAAVPFLPFVPVPGMFIFENPQDGGNWFDPPAVDTFRYTLEGDGDEFFTIVGVPDGSFGFDPVELWIDDNLIATLLPDEIFDFVANGFDDVSMFEIRAISPLLDLEDPDLATAFPTFLDFVGDPTRLLMDAIAVVGGGGGGPTTPVSSPATLLLLGTGLGIIVTVRRRRSRR